MRKILLLHIILLCSVLSWAQATGVPYNCSFEATEDLSNWEMNPLTPSAADQWIIGNVAHSEGHRSMYISSDGKNPVYGSQPNVVVSYLRYKFPETGKQQNYDLSFDWKCVGDTNNSYLQVMVCPEVLLEDKTQPYYLDNIVNAPNGIISPTVVNNAFIELGASRQKFVCGSSEWQNVSVSKEIRVSSNFSRYTFAIVFIWVNRNKDAELSTSSICIDNIQIGDATIKKPQNMKVESVCEDSVMEISWESGLNEFEVQYRKLGTSTWRRADGLMDGVDGFTRIDGIYCSYRLQRVEEGSYDVRVCGKAGDLVTIFTYCNQFLVYCPENHCINYLDFDSPNVECTYGYHPLTSGHTSETPYSYRGYIDLGPNSEASRHTIHTDPTEVDPRTDDGLRTVPPGELASVRLGNWKTGGEAESITYNIMVDSANQGVLIVKYAVVLQNPQGHPHEQEPSFLMEVLDENGNLIDASCGRAEFSYSDAVAAGWNMTKDEKAVWKDWTSVGVNLMPYHNQSVKVRFTTFDCSQSGHYGYAYFTVDCATAHLKTENCGNDSQIECYAPPGFAYTWFKGNPDDNVIVSTDRILTVDPSRQEYTCRVSFIEDPDCYFDVTTISSPRFPIPEYKVERVYQECTSKLKFHNTSHVMNKYEGFEQHTQEPTTDCYWTFRRLSDGSVYESYNWSPVFTCLPTGDTLEVTCTTYIGVENACDSMRVDTIITPNINPEHTEFHQITCAETPVQFGGKWFTKDTVYVGLFPNFAGCDSTSTLYLNVLPEIEDTYRHDSICSDGKVTIGGVVYNQPMDNQLIMLKSINGCDSALYMSLTVNQRLDATVDSLPYSCADDGELYFMLNIADGQFDSLVIRFNTPQLRDTTIYDSSVRVVAIPYSDTITPGHYSATLVFYQFCCGIYRETRDIEVRYRSSIVEQKWNDVLTLLAPKYNGGYSFTAIQWYKNGEPLAGENNPYLYQTLDLDAEYYVELTNSDGVTMKTCPVQPVYHEQQTPFPTIVNAGQQMPLYLEQETMVWYFYISGQFLSSARLPQGYTSLTAPATTGVYILKSVNKAGDTHAQIIIVE